jgi:rhodanese-related sulfurtransferase
MTTMTEIISPTDLREALTQGCLLVDVREPVEHAEEHIAGARLIPLGQLEQQADSMDREGPLVIMCRSGKRGAQALAKLKALGFNNTRNLEGGIEAWKGAGLPVSKSAGKVFPLMQQVQIIIGLGVLTGVVLSFLAHPNWILLSGFFGAGLVFAGSTGWCGMAILMSKMPWNRVSGQSSCASGSCAAAK